MDAIERPGCAAVIGAGPHGLSALKALLQAGIPADGFDRADDLGGNWNFGGPTSRVYESTHLISSKPFTQFPDFPMPDSYPDYPSHRQVKAYFDAYADHFGLRERISFGTSVVRVAVAQDAPETPFGPRWDVTVERGGRQWMIRYDAVVVANGHNWSAKLPDYAGLSDFGGEILHSADYKGADQLRGRRVLVVGAGNTGCDIAVEAAQNAIVTYHSTRRGYYYSPKFVFGKPSDQIADLLLAARMPLPLRRLAFAATLRTTMGKFEDFGLQKPDHAFFETHPIVNQQLVYYVGHGDITPTRDVDHFDADGAVFADGSRADVDLVVFATGYLAVFPFLADQDALDASLGRPHLALQMASPKYANLWLSGLIQPDSGQWTIAHWQGTAIADFLALAQRDPQRARAIHDRINAQRERRFSGGTHYKESTRHYYEIAHQDYLEVLEDFLSEVAT
ncbi:MAG: FAD-dependent oxidoreductase [Candidatus Nanopelagicales bacterium]